MNQEESLPEFTDLTELKQTWASGQFGYPDKMFVGGIKYAYRGAFEGRWDDIVIKGQMPYLLYTTAKSNLEQARELGLRQLIVFVWGIKNGSSIIPYDIRTMPVHRLIPSRLKEDRDVIGDVALIKIELPSGIGILKGKIDTGAEISSLHTDSQPKIIGDVVKFLNQELSDNIITVPVIDKQAVSSADGGIEYRPVIELDIEINGKKLKKVMFNLNDRSQMQYPILVGQNILEKAGFLVDPNRNDITEELEDWIDDELLDEIFNQPIKLNQDVLKETQQTIPENTSIDQETVDEIIEIIENNDSLFSQVFKKIRTEALLRTEQIEY